MQKNLKSFENKKQQTRYDRSEGDNTETDHAGDQYRFFHFEFFYHSLGGEREQKQHDPEQQTASGGDTRAQRLYQRHEKQSDGDPENAEHVDIHEGLGESLAEIVAAGVFLSAFLAAVLLVIGDLLRAVITLFHKQSLLSEYCITAERIFQLFAKNNEYQIKYR